MRWILACFCVLLGCGYIFLTGWYPDVAWLQGLFPGLIWPVAITTLALLLMLLARHLLAHDPLLSSWAILGLAGCLLIIPLILAREQQAKLDHIAEERLAESREALRIELIRKQKIEKERIQNVLANR